MTPSPRLSNAARVGLAVGGCFLVGLAVLAFVGFSGIPCDGSDPDCRPEIASAAGMILAALAAAAFLAAGLSAYLGAGTGSRRWAVRTLWTSGVGLLGVIAAASVLVPS